MRYRTCGSNHGECDRGRSLTAMDAELMAICAPQHTAKMRLQAEPAAVAGKQCVLESPKLGAATADCQVRMDGPQE